MDDVAFAAGYIAAYHRAITARAVQEVPAVEIRWAHEVPGTNVDAVT